MEQAVERVFTEAVVQRALQAFGLSAEGMKELGSFENYVYEAYREGEPVILRFTHSSHRQPAEVESELDWVLHLAREGVELQGPLAASNGAYVVPIAAEDGTVFSASLFEKAEGHHARFANPEEWNERLFREWGRKTGEIHRATCRYVRPEHLPMRSHWDEDDLLQNARDYIDADDEWMLEKLEALFRHFKGLPRTADAYGLLHTDIHPGNFFVDGDRLRVFDFDDCSYTWFAHDLAIPLYYATAWATPESYQGDCDRFAADFFRAFWSGYAEEYTLDPVWLNEIPALLKLRDLTLYLVIKKKVGPEELEKDAGARRILKENRERIERDVPIVTVDYHALLQG
ncbi:phosphotransferase enzyme family protein [Gorillibacterium sp. sgz500922]|uniref:phosphotransferase enzyme family protein n=1 Tax=Gorillibacterium sp. sgz500922 TaxID=3446694 RepID=UPI003F67D69A